MLPSYLVISFDSRSSFSLPRPKTEQNPYLFQPRKEEVEAVEEVVAGELVEVGVNYLTKRGFQ
jgi:hypothetical protein